MFRYLQAYDNGVIWRNLLSLLFIVIFPFTASGLMHVTPSFVFPMLIYFFNLTFVFLSNYLLSSYIFKRKPALSVPGHEAEKKYIYMDSKGLAIAFGVCFVVILTTAIITNFDSKAINKSFYVLIFILPATKRWLKKYKPKKNVRCWRIVNSACQRKISPQMTQIFTEIFCVVLWRLWQFLS